MLRITLILTVFFCLIAAGNQSIKEFYQICNTVPLNSKLVFNTVGKPAELNPADLIQCVGQSFNQQKIFAVSDFTEPPVTIEDEYPLMIISKTIKNPKQFRLFGIPLDELHIGLDSTNKILAVFVRLKNKGLVKKKEKAIGDEYMAMSVTPADVEAPPSTYWWDYKGQCVSLRLYANQRMFITERLPDEGFVTFFNCDPNSYMDIHVQTAEADEPGFTNPEVQQQKNEFLQLAYSFYPKGISDQDEIYGMTPQFRKLYETLQKNDYLDEKWQQLLNILQQRFECREIGIPNPIRRGYWIAIVLKIPKPHSIVVNVSKLIPYYCFYTQLPRKNKPAGRLGDFIFKDFIPSDQEIVNWVSEQIQLHFEGYKELPPALPLVRFKDVEFEDNGVLQSVDELYPSHFESMTLFNAFFSSNMFYW
ncbi:MAG: hypothetical protein WCF67_14985 [Chitinophagaceae bacterium]